MRLWSCWSHDFFNMHLNMTLEEAQKFQINLTKRINRKPKRLYFNINGEKFNLFLEESKDMLTELHRVISDAMLGNFNAGFYAERKFNFHLGERPIFLNKFALQIANIKES